MTNLPLQPRGSSKKATPRSKNNTSAKKARKAPVSDEEGESEDEASDDEDDAGNGSDEDADESATAKKSKKGRNAGTPASGKKIQKLAPKDANTMKKKSSVSKKGKKTEEEEAPVATGSLFGKP